MADPHGFDLIRNAALSGAAAVAAPIFRTAPTPIPLAPAAGS